jgi:hypothetical protein
MADFVCPRAGAMADPVAHQSLVACGGSKTVSVAVHVPPADCACSIARRVCVEIDSTSADGTRRVAVPIFVRVYALVADGTRRPAVAVAISASVLTANPACRVAVPISVGVLAAIADSTCRITRLNRVKAILAVGRKNGYCQRQRCKDEASHRTPLLLLVQMAAGHIGPSSRCLKGEKPADLPVQAPTKVRAGH